MAFDNKTLKDNFEYSGEWWLPSSKENKFSGKVKFIPEQRIILETYVDSQAILNGIGFWSGDPIEAVHGISYSGKRITLYNLRVHPTSIPPYAHTIVTYDVEHIFLNTHFESIDSLDFYYAELNIENLEKWFGLTFKSEHKREDQDVFRTIHVHGKGYEEKTTYIESIESYICFSCGVSQQGVVSDKISLSYNASATIKPTSTKKLNWFREKILKFQSLLTFLTGIPIDILNIHLFIDDPTKDETYLESHRNRIEFIYLSPSYLSNQQVESRDMLTILPQIETKLEVYIDNWFANESKYREINNIFFGTLSSKPMYLENKFLSRIQVLESFHRRRYEAKYVEDQAYEEILDILQSSVPQNTPRDLRKKLLNTLKYANQFSLRKRLKQLVDDVWEGCFEHFVDDKKNDFIRSVVDTRNYLTHLDNESKGKVIAGIELYFLNERLKYLFIIHTLILMGAETQDIYLHLRAYKQISRFSPQYHW